jgi:2-succinyl-6-hydroxy-2,4-cyclohexadiene-1-carboxylate synthase
MNIKFAGFNINAELKSYSGGSSGFIFFLHGFTGSSEDWDQIIPDINPRFTCAAVDLIGHGKSDSPQEFAYYTADSIADQILNTIDAFTNEKIILAGYSMGGRAALNFTLKNPGKVKGLILESASPGIKDEEERRERIKKDSELAEFISTHSMQDFVDYWMNIDLFATQLRFSKSKREEIKKKKLKNNKTGLINSLKSFGTGAMLPLFDQLQNINCKTLLITGGLDVKFSEMNSGILKFFPSAEHVIINTAGHNTHLEEPAKFTQSINEFLKYF